MSASIIDGRAIARRIQVEVELEVAWLRKAEGASPGLAVVLVGDDPASRVYVAAKEKAAMSSGIYTQTILLPGDCGLNDLLQQIEALNRAPEYHGILLQLPLPSHIDTMSAIRALSPLKDVDGLHPENMGLLLMGTPRFVPCTPAGIHRLLVDSGISPSGKHMVICGRSRIVGRPLAAMMLQKEPEANATVTIAHTGTREMAILTRQADILVAAIDSPKGITADMVKEGSVVVDVGIHRVADPATEKGYRIVGDVDFDSVKEKVAAITPVPGGVGPMTVSMLLVNTLKAFKLALGTTRPQAAPVV